MSEERDPLCLVACGDAGEFGQAVARELGCSVLESRDVWFACGEAKHVLSSTVRASDVYILQRPLVPGDRDRSVYDRFMMALHAVDACRCADAARVTLVMPYLPGARQDKRKNHVREGVSTGLFARLLEAAGVSMLVTVEPHNEATIGCFNPSKCVFEAVGVGTTYARHLLAMGWGPDVVASTDVGGMEQARLYAHALKAELVACSKRRDYKFASIVADTAVIGDVAGKRVLIVDDIVDTGGSVVSAVNALWEAGATDISVAAVHPVLSHPAWERLTALKRAADERGVVFRMVGTSSVEHVNAPDWYHTFRLEPLLAKVIRSVNQRRSVRALE